MNTLEKDIKDIVFIMLEKYSNTEGTYNDICLVVLCWILQKNVFKDTGKDYYSYDVTEAINKCYDEYYKAS